MSDHGDQNYGEKGMTLLFVILTFFFILSVILYVYYYNFRLEF